MTSDAGEVANDFSSLGRGRGLDHCQIETVVAVLREMAAGFGELNKKGTRLALAT
ncbi:hypothetical protein D3C74_501670 [compost metagenome]